MPTFMIGHIVLGQASLARRAVWTDSVGPTIVVGLTFSDVAHSATVESWTNNAN